MANNSAEIAALERRLALLRANNTNGASDGNGNGHGSCSTCSNGMTEAVAMLAEALYAGRELPCGEFPRRKLDANGCPTGTKICKREQTLSDTTIGIGATATATIQPPNEATAIAFHTTITTAADFTVNSVMIGSRTVVQGPIPLSSWNAANRRDANVGWGKFESNTPINISLTNNTAAAVNANTLASLEYRSEED